METPKHRSMIVEQGNVANLLVKFIQTKDTEGSSTGRLKLLQAVTSTLWILSADEDYGSFLIEQEVIHHLVDIMYTKLTEYQNKPLTHDIILLLQNVRIVTSY